MRFRELDKAKDRLNHIESSVITKENKIPFSNFKRNNEYSTLWDDKKLLAKKNTLTPINPQGNNNIYNNDGFANQNLNDAYNKNLNVHKNINDNNFNQNKNANNYKSSSQYGAYFQNQMSQQI
jgi:hypothetical protein